MRAAFGMSALAGSPAADAQSEAMNGVLARNWWAVAARGVAAMIFGLAAILLPAATLLSLLLAFCAYMLVDGVLTLIAAVRAAGRTERWGLLIVQGLANLAAAAIALLWPGLTVLAFVFILAAWAIFSGALMLGSAFRLKWSHGRIWMGLSGLLAIAGGAFLILAPILGAFVLAWWIGAYVMLFGLSQFFLAFELWGRRNGDVGLSANAMI